MAIGDIDWVKDLLWSKQTNDGNLAGPNRRMGAPMSPRSPNWPTGSGWSVGEVARQPAGWPEGSNWAVPGRSVPYAQPRGAASAATPGSAVSKVGVMQQAQANLPASWMNAIAQQQQAQAAQQLALGSGQPGQPPAVPGQMPRQNIGPATHTPYGSGTVPGQPAPGGGALPPAPGAGTPTGSRTIYANPPRVAPQGGPTGFNFQPPGAEPLGNTGAPSSGIPSGHTTIPKPASQMIGGDAGLGQHGPINGRQPADTAMGVGMGKALSGSGKSIGSSILSDAMTKNRQFKGAGLLGHIGVPLAAGMAQGFVNENASDTASVGPVNKGTLNSTLGGMSAGALVGGVPGGIAGGVGAGVGDAGATAINQDTQDAGVAEGGLVGALRGITPIPGIVASVRDANNTEAAGGLPGLFQEGGKLSAVGGFLGMGGEGQDQPVEEVVTPQNRLDRVWDSLQTDKSTRQVLQNLYNARTGAGEDPEAVAQELMGVTFQDYQEQAAEQQQMADLAAQQAMAVKYMQPYADSIRSQGLAEQQLLQSLMPQLPAAYQAYGQYAANSAPMRANTLADSYMLQASMAPSQAMQQRQAQQQQAYDNQLNSQIMNMQIAAELEAMQASGQLPATNAQSGL